MEGITDSSLHPDAEGMADTSHASLDATLSVDRTTEGLSELLPGEPDLTPGAELSTEPELTGKTELRPEPDLSLGAELTSGTELSIGPCLPSALVEGTTELRPGEPDRSLGAELTSRTEGMTDPRLDLSQGPGPELSLGPCLPSALVECILEAAVEDHPGNLSLLLPVSRPWYHALTRGMKHHVTVRRQRQIPGVTFAREMVLTTPLSLRLEKGSVTSLQLVIGPQQQQQRQDEQQQQQQQQEQQQQQQQPLQELQEELLPQRQEQEQQQLLQPQQLQEQQHRRIQQGEEAAQPWSASLETLFIDNIPIVFTPLPSTTPPPTAGPPPAPAPGHAPIAAPAPVPAFLPFVNTTTTESEVPTREAVQAAFPSLTSLSLRFQGTSADLPGWTHHLPRVQHLSLRNTHSYIEVERTAGPLVLSPTLKSLKMQDLGCRRLPASLLSCHALTDLTLVGMPAVDLPPSIGSLRSLKRLRLVRSGVQTLPVDVTDLRNLSLIHIEKCGSFSDLPGELGRNLRNSLEVLKVTCPGEFMERRHFSELQSLPRDLGQCLNLKVLTLNSDEMRELPASLGGLNSLTRLRLEMPELRDLPDVFHSLLSLEELVVFSDALSALPPSLASQAGSATSHSNSCSTSSNTASHNNSGSSSHLTSKTVNGSSSSSSSHKSKTDGNNCSSATGSSSSSSSSSVRGSGGDKPQSKLQRVALFCSALRVVPAGFGSSPALRQLAVTGLLGYHLQLGPGLESLCASFCRNKFLEKAITSDVTGDSNNVINDDVTDGGTAASRSGVGLRPGAGAGAGAGAEVEVVAGVGAGSEAQAGGKARPLRDLRLHCGWGDPAPSCPSHSASAKLLRTFLTTLPSLTSLALYCPAGVCYPRKLQNLPALRHLQIGRCAPLSRKDKLDLKLKGEWEEPAQGSWNSACKPAGGGAEGKGEALPLAEVSTGGATPPIPLLSCQPGEGGPGTGDRLACLWREHQEGLTARAQERESWNGPMRPSAPLAFPPGIFNDWGFPPSTHSRGAPGRGQGAHEGLVGDPSTVSTHPSRLSARPSDDALGDDFFPEAPALETLRLDCGQLKISRLPESVVHLGRLRSLSVEDAKVSSLPEGLGQLKLLEVLKLHNLPLVRKLPGSLRGLAALRRLQVSDCEKLENFEFSPAWANLEVLQISECPRLPSPGGALAVYQRLTSLHLGCSLMHPEPPELGNLRNLKIFRISSGRNCGSREHGWGTVVPPSLSALPGLKFIEAAAACVSEIPTCLTKVTSLESLVFGSPTAGIHDYHSLLAVPSPSDLPPQVPFWQREALHEEVVLPLMRMEHLETHWLPSSVHCLPSLTSLSLVGYRRPSLPPSVGDLKTLIFLSMGRCPELGAIGAEISLLPELSYLLLCNCPKVTFFGADQGGGQVGKGGGNQEGKGGTSGGGRGHQGGVGGGSGGSTCQGGEGEDQGAETGVSSERQRHANGGEGGDGGGDGRGRWFPMLKEVEIHECPSVDLQCGVLKRPSVEVRVEECSCEPVRSYN